MWTRNNFNRNFASNFSSSQKKTLIIKTKCTYFFNKLLYFTLFGVCLRACRAKLWETFLRSSFITSRIWSPGRRRPPLKAAPKKQNDQIRPYSNYPEGGGGTLRDSPAPLLQRKLYFQGDRFLRGAGGA